VRTGAQVNRSIMLSSDALKRIDREIAKYPPEHRQSAVIAALAIAQDEHAWLSTETMDFVAHYLGMPSIAVYEVATFYEMFDTEPTGKYKLTICTNLPCALSSATQAAAHLKQKLGIGFGETTADGLFTLKEGECFGACGDAPVVLVNNKRMCSWMMPEQLDGLIAELSAEAKR
jgi:NADH-quinone oxidoreductase subunit E